MAWVVRAGEAKAQDLIAGYVPHLSVPGLFGFSVQAAPGLGVDELALSGHFPHATISYEDDVILAAALATIGYRLELVASPGIGHHHTFCVLYDTTGTRQHHLPPAAAQVLAQTFQRKKNPHPFPRRRHP